MSSCVDKYDVTDHVIEVEPSCDSYILGTFETTLVGVTFDDCQSHLEEVLRNWPDVELRLDWDESNVVDDTAVQVIARFTSGIMEDIEKSLGYLSRSTRVLYSSLLEDTPSLLLGLLVGTVLPTKGSLARHCDEYRVELVRVGGYPGRESQIGCTVRIIPSE